MPTPLRHAAAAAAALTVLTGLVPASAQAGTTPSPAGPVVCSSTFDPLLAAQVAADVTDAQSGRSGTIAFTLHDTEDGLSCTDNADTRFDSASVVKVTIMGAVLRRAQEEGRPLTAAEVGDLKPMITRSDNAAAGRLWAALGPGRLRAFLDLAGMDETVLGPGQYWGLTRITARDEMRLLDVCTSTTPVLSAGSRAYALALMSSVEADQRWGTPYGAPAGVRVMLKNGWLPRATRGWRVHSLGVFTAPGLDYRMVVLTDGNATMGYGVDTIQRIARVVHRDLDESGGSSLPLPPPTAPAGVEAAVVDGSASGAVTPGDIQ